MLAATAVRRQTWSHAETNPYKSSGGSHSLFTCAAENAHHGYSEGAASPQPLAFEVTSSSTIVKETHMKKLWISVATAALLIAAHPASAAWQGIGGRIDARQQQQQARIADGARSGDLTHREVHRLQNEQRAIRCTERSYRSDGVLTRPERRALHSDLNRASRHIYNQRHDYQRRAPYAAPRYGRPWHHRWHDHHYYSRHHGPWH